MSRSPALWLLTPSELEAACVRAIVPSTYPVESTGVGALATLHNLWRRWHQEQPKELLLIVLGIAGSYRRYIEIPSVVYVQSEIWGDLGRRYRRNFQPAPEWLRGSLPWRWHAPLPPLPLPAVTGLTVHTVSASRWEARYWQRTYPEADIETQEGAAYFLFGQAVHAPIYAFRVLSNYVGHRHWMREAALDLLATFTAQHVVPLCERLLDRDIPADPR